MTVKEFIDYIFKDERVTEDTHITFRTDMGFEEEITPADIDIYSNSDYSVTIEIW